MDFLTKNLETLAEAQPGLARALGRVRPPAEVRIEPTRSGLAGLVAGSQRLTSSVDPLREGQSLAASAPSGPLAVFGFGMGYHLEFIHNQDIVVFDPSPDVVRRALEARDLTRVLKRIRLATRLEDLGDIRGRGIMIHRPSARLNPLAASGFQRLAAESPRLGPRPSKPRVLVVPPVLGGSLPIAYWCAEAFEALGCQVRTLPMDALFPLYDLVRKSRQPANRLDRVRAPMVSFLSELTVLEAENFNPHLCFVMAQAPLNRRALADISRLGAVTAFWFIENYRHMAYFREIAAAYDHFFHIQGSQMEEHLAKLGANYQFLPMAAHPPMHRPMELSPGDRARYGADVGFMGAGYPNRVAFFTRLMERGLEFRLWGSGWPGAGQLMSRLFENGRRLESDEVSKVYNSCRIVLNLHSSIEEDRGAGQSDYLNPRTFEAPACGAFQLVDKVRGMEAMLAPGKEVAVFEREEELADMVRHYLDNPELCARMAQAGRRRVLKDHTYYHRMEAVLSRCLGAAPNQRPGSGDAAENMLYQLAPPGRWEQPARNGEAAAAQLRAIG